MGAVDNSQDPAESERAVLVPARLLMLTNIIWKPPKTNPTMTNLSASADTYSVIFKFNGTTELSIEEPLSVQRKIPVASEQVNN